MPDRIERDALGDVRVPADALYGPHTQRAIDNFPISGQPLPRRFLWAIGHIKRACALANEEIGEIERRVAVAIVEAADEVIAGHLDVHFPVDVYQTGSGTSTNMNANEVIAARVNQHLGAGTAHPNDHVNRAQSSNDVVPSALHVAGAAALEEDLLPALRHLTLALDTKAAEFHDIVKSGRTHLMDATPVRLGQEVGGWAAQVRAGVRRAEAARDALLELALGGTAVGTGLNAPPGFAARAIRHVSAAVGLPFREATNHFEAQGARDGVVEAHGQLATIAASLHKIANDVRLLGSGPRAGLYEIRLPATQAGSSMMPGKVNPVMCEMVTMVSARVAGNQTTVQIAGMSGHLQLNAYLPILAVALLESATLLASAARTFADRCVVGMEANRSVCEASVERNLSLGTAIAPLIGYERASDLAREAFKTGQTLRDILLARHVLPRDLLDELLDPRAMTGRPE